MILFQSVQRNVYVSQVRVPLSGVKLFFGDGLPTPKRWKRLVPQGTGSMRFEEDGVPSFLFPRTGVG